MAKDHGARQQKKVAKQKAKRSDKRTELSRRASNDPTVRLQRADKWPVVQSLIGANLWKEGIGYLAIARQEVGGQLVFGVYLVDVYCLGVKDAFWETGTLGDFKDIIGKMDKTQKMCPISPACLAKIVTGAVEFALSFGFRPHPDFRHVAMLLEGIDPAACSQELPFGRDGKPYYIQGPYESFEKATAIMNRVREAGGHSLAVLSVPDWEELDDIEDEDDDLA